MRSRLDPFVVALVIAAALGTLVPLGGAALGAAMTAQMYVIAGLFGLYGLRVPTREAIDGLTAWRSHLLVLSMTFLIFPVLGWLVTRTPLTAEAIVPGLLFLCLVPTTMQSSVVTTSIAGGDRAFAIVATSLSSLCGVVATPLLVSTLMGGDVVVTFDSVVTIMLIVLVPFVLGQLLRARLSAAWSSRIRRHETLLRLYDRGSVLLVVYLGFSNGRESNVWSAIRVRDIVVVVSVCGLLFVCAWLASMLVSVRLSRPRRLAVLFCGSNKSLAAGLPMAAILMPTDQIALTIVPLMIYHQIQIIASTVIAQRLASRAR